MKWSQKQFNAIRGQVADEISELTEQGQRLDLLLSIIHKNSDTSDQIKLKTAYASIVFALVEHQQSGGLNSRTMDQLLAHARDILALLNVPEHSSTLSARYSDLNVIHAQILSREGRHWQAFLEHSEARRISGKYVSGGLGFHLFMQGRYLLRLGNGSDAIKNFDQALEKGLESRFAIKCMLTQANAYRLARRLDEAKMVLEKARNFDEQNSDIEDMIKWESTCIDFVEKGSLSPQIELCEKSAKDRRVVYQIENYLWIRSLVESEPMIRRISAPSKITKPRQVKFDSHKAMIECARAIEFGYDNSRSLGERTALIGAALESTQKILTIDRWLLVRTAAIRWASRYSEKDIQNTLTREYRSMSLQLTGTSQDCLNVMPDLVKNDQTQLSA